MRITKKLRFAAIFAAATLLSAPALAASVLAGFTFTIQSANILSTGFFAVDETVAEGPHQIVGWSGWDVAETGGMPMTVKALSGYNKSNISDQQFSYFANNSLYPDHGGTTQDGFSFTTSFVDAMNVYHPGTDYSVHSNGVQQNCQMNVCVSYVDLRISNSNMPNAGLGRGGENASFQLVPEYITTNVPEPANWALMIAGFGMVGFTARRNLASHMLSSLS